MNNLPQNYECKSGSDLGKTSRQFGGNGEVSFPYFPCSTLLENDNTIKVWDLVTGKQLLILSEDNIINAVAISPNGLKIVSASSDKTVKVWDLNTGQEMITFIGDSAFYCCAINTDNQTIVAGDGSGMLHFLRIEGLDVNGVD